jgi:hypothetical protein
MKRTILNLIAAAALLFGWAAQAADEMQSNTPSPETQPVVETVAVPEATAPVTAPPATAQETLPPAKHSSLHKHVIAKHGRSHDLDLRDCLDLTTNIEIAKCAGE